MLIDSHSKLYPQYNVIKDRRTQTEPVSFERRSGRDRREDNRIHLDTNLTRDIFEIKSKVSQLQKPSEKRAEAVSFKQNSGVAAQYSLNADQFVKTTKPDMAEETPKEASKKKSSSASLAGAIAFMGGGIAAATLMGPVGATVAVGMGVYFGAKLLKESVSSHLNKK